MLPKSVVRLRLQTSYLKVLRVTENIFKIFKVFFKKTEKHSVSEYLFKAYIYVKAIHKLIISHLGLQQFNK